MTQVLDKDSDAGVLDMPGEYVTPKKPIRMGIPRHFEPMYVSNGDSIEFTLKDKARAIFGVGIPFTNREVYKETIGINKAMAVDTFIPLEVIDEFGLDVGIGCLIGQSKKR